MTIPLVSVLLLTFNRPAALARCLDSLSLQTQQNFEVVLVDVSTPPNHAANHALVKAHGDGLARISHQRSRLTRCGAREGVGDRRS